MNKFISRTGRVQSWLDNPESRLPVSCTVFVVEDSMEGPEGIEASWRFASHALRNAQVVPYMCQNSGRTATKMEKGSQLVDLYPLQKSTQH